MTTGPSTPYSVMSSWTSPAISTPAPGAVSEIGKLTAFVTSWMVSAPLASAPLLPLA